MQQNIENSLRDMEVGSYQTLDRRSRKGKFNSVYTRSILASKTTTTNSMTPRKWEIDMAWPLLMGPCQTLHEAKIIVQFVNRQMEDQRRPNSCTAQCLAITQKGLILQHCALNFLRLK